MDSTRDRHTAFMTHNGLKVRLNHDFCAYYLEEKNILPWYVSIEAFDSLRGILSIVTAIVLMFTHKDPILSGLLISVVYLYGFYVSQSLFDMVLFNLIYGYFYMLYSLLSRFFIQYIALLIITVVIKEYFILLSFLIARVVCLIIVHTLIIMRGRYFRNKYGVYLGDVEITAAKLLQFYSHENIRFKQWLLEYSRFMVGKDIGS